jgi:hypothetical protein
MEPHLSQAAADHQVDSAVAIEIAERGEEGPALPVRERRYGQLDRLAQRRRNSGGDDFRRLWPDQVAGSGKVARWLAGRQKVIHSLCADKLDYSAGLNAVFPFQHPKGEGNDGESGHDESDGRSGADHPMGRLAFVLLAHGCLQSLDSSEGRGRGQFLRAGLW